MMRTTPKALKQLADSPHRSQSDQAKAYPELRNLLAEILIHAKGRVDNLPEEGELDVPGADLDDDDEELGEEDEENNYYSLGGDRHESQEED